MAFDTYAASESAGTKESTVDYDALNQYIVETAGLQERETLVGVVAGIVDLGTQDQQDSEVVFKGSEDDEADEIAKNSNTYFKDGFDPVTKKPARMKCWPNKPIQCVALAIDFPDIVVDKGQFFGESKELPLRVWMGGQFYTEANGMVIGRPIPLKISKKTGAWSFDAKHQFYKMAVDAKLIKPGEAFLPKEIDKLLGLSFQFQVQVYMKEAKNGKEYYTEYIKYVGGLGRGQKAPDYPLEPFVIQFNQKNPEEKLKELRWHVINTIKQASNYPGSAIELQLGEAKDKGEKEDKPKVAEKPPEKVTAPKVVPKPKVKTPVVEEDFDDSQLPF